VTDLERVAGRLRAARQENQKASDAAKAAAREAVAGGMSESEAARQLGVTRMTIRKWIGKV